MLCHAWPRIAMYGAIMCIINPMQHRNGNWLLLAMLLVGCGVAPQSDLMPLKVGRVATYTVTAGFDKMVDPLKVTREVPVAGTTGYEMTASFGTSRLAWKDGVLVAAQTANAFFVPPIPLVSEDGKDKTWTGKVEAMGARSPATATLTQKEDANLEIGTKKYKARATELTIKMPRGTITVSSWFVPKIGLVQQEQRTNDQFVLRLELLHGPTPGN